MSRSAFLAFGLPLAALLPMLACFNASTCVTGASVSCACQGGGQGTQVCQPGGTYSVCACLNPDAGMDGGMDAGPLPAQAQILVDRTALAFGSEFGEGIVLGQTPRETLQIKNGGQAALVVSAVSISGPSTAFLADQLAVNQSVPSGQSAFITVTYSPVATGTDTASLQIASNAQNSPTLAVPLNAVTTVDGGF